jgi:uncharacterized protein YbcI
MALPEEPSSVRDASSEPPRSPAMQISNAVGHVHKQLVGRGPTNVRTHIHDDVVLCLLEGGFTQAERTVWENLGEEAVIELRLHLQAAMRREIVEAVEAIIGRRVRCFMSANDPEHDVQSEIMLLGSAMDVPAPRSGGCLPTS